MIFLNTLFFFLLQICIFRKEIRKMDIPVCKCIMIYCMWWLNLIWFLNMEYCNTQALSQNNKAKESEKCCKLRFAYVSGEKQHGFSLENLFPVYKTFHVQYHKYPLGGYLCLQRRCFFPSPRISFAFHFSSSNRQHANLWLHFTINDITRHERVDFEYPRSLLPGETNSKSVWCKFLT